MSEKLTYPDDAIARSTESAIEWLKEHDIGYPRSWHQETSDTARRGYDLYDEFEAPPIAGYERLEKQGFVVRQDAITTQGRERVPFMITPAGRSAIGEP